MGDFDSYRVEEVPKAIAQAMVVENHYLHRKAPAMFSYGLYEGDDLLGVIIYGKPASYTLCIGVCGPDESSNVIELTRLWIRDDTLFNSESFFIGATLRMLPIQYDIVVSYAEIGAGHRGVVYQSTNWLYTGMSDRHALWMLDGKPVGHARHRFDEWGGEAGAKIHFGDRMTRYERPRKHRYVMLRGSKTRRKELRKKLRYKTQPYPKS